ncbi:long-chain-fatty-acid--CoA ligase [Caldiplasma sukawensis]
MENENNFERLWEKNYPEYVKRELEIPEISLYQLFKKTLEKSEKNVAINFIGKKINYDELNRYVNKAAAFLIDNNVKEGDRIGIMLPNSPQYVILFMAAMKIGAIVVQVNPLYTSYEVKYEMEDSGCNVLIILEDFYEKISTLYPITIKKIIFTRIQDFLPGFVGSIFSLSRKIKGQSYKISENNNVVKLDLDKYEGKETKEAIIKPRVTPAVIQYTGGTTGKPKGALLSHYNLVSNVYQLDSWLPENIKGKLIFLSAIPFFHVYGMMTAFLMPLFYGTTMIILPDPRDSERVLKSIEKHKNIVFPGIPTMYHSMLKSKHLKQNSLKGVSLLLSGAAPLPEEIETEFTSRSNASILEGYGLTEASPVVCATPVDPKSRRKGTVGFPIPSTHLKIVDIETGEELGIDKPGELIVKGPQVMLGYLNSVDETKLVMEDGWLHTGDVALIDKDGYVHIVDRTKDLIIAGGYNIYPREVEEVIFQHPKVDDVAVVGVKDIHRGETVKAVIVLKQGVKMSEDEIKSFCAQRLAVYKVPRIIEFRDSLPRNIVGKVLKRELREENR